MSLKISRHLRSGPGGTERSAEARRAIALPPGLGEAHSSLGQILQYRLRWVESHEAFERGIALSPDYATGHHWYSYDLMMRNRWDEAITEMERAKQLDPLSEIIVTSLGFAYDGAERPGEAEAQFDQARAIAPDHPLTLSFGFSTTCCRETIRRPRPTTGDTWWRPEGTVPTPP